MDDPQKHAMWKESDTDTEITQDLILFKIL